MKRIFSALVLIVLMFTSCNLNYSRETVYFKNQTNKDLEVFILKIDADSISLPENQPNLKNVDANSSRILVDISFPIEEYFSNYEDGTIHVFVIDRDTLNFYDWSVIRDENKIVQQYDTQFTDLVFMGNVLNLIHE